MASKLLVLAILFGGVLASITSKADPVTAVRTIAPQSENDASHSYFIGLLELALSHSQDKYGEAQVLLSPDTSTQGRWFRMLQGSRYLDVIWAGSDVKREQDYAAVPVDLLGGILGVRALIIRKQDRPQFLNISKLADLKQMVACHGKHWPDTEILRQAGLSVMTSSKYEANFVMLERERCDYFPRGIHEGYSEIAQYHVLNGNRLTLFDDLLIVYPFNMWFFVDKQNTKLLERLTYGLTAARDDGSLLAFLQQHMVTAHLFPLNKWADKTVIFLPNDQVVSTEDKKAWWLLQQMPFYSRGYSNGLNK